MMKPSSFDDNWKNLQILWKKIFFIDFNFLAEKLFELISVPDYFSTAEPDNPIADLFCAPLVKGRWSE